MIYRRNTGKGGATCPGSRVPGSAAPLRHAWAPLLAPVPRQVCCPEPIKYGLIVRQLGMENQD